MSTGYVSNRAQNVIKKSAPSKQVFDNVALKFFAARKRAATNSEPRIRLY